MADVCAGSIGNGDYLSVSAHHNPSVSVISSITFEVSKVSTSPTNAKDTEYGKIMRNVSIVN